MKLAASVWLAARRTVSGVAVPRTQRGFWVRRLSNQDSPSCWMLLLLSISFSCSWTGWKPLSSLTYMRSNCHKTASSSLG